MLNDFSILQSYFIIIICVLLNKYNTYVYVSQLTFPRDFGI